MDQQESVKSSEEAQRPNWVPAHATMVRQLVPGLWMWEFSGGSHLVLAWADGSGDLHSLMSIPYEAFEQLLTELQRETPRYRAAFRNEALNRAAYQEYVGSLPYEPDHWGDS